MGNPLPVNTHKGTLGELLVQLRLLEYGIQAAAPIKDSGNDLIAIKGEITKFILVKTENRLREMPLIYHYAAIVELETDANGSLLLDQSRIWFIKKGEGLSHKRLLTKDLVEEIFG
ncbi:hypothetical protein HY839_00025 [Candidatus Azambacteria bacterium]|nr:hypothetical protein [Candidatus Azambacteria bacterium]